MSLIEIYICTDLNMRRLNRSPPSYLDSSQRRPFCMHKSWLFWILLLFRAQSYLHRNLSRCFHMLSEAWRKILSSFWSFYIKDSQLFTLVGNSLIAPYQQSMRNNSNSWAQDSTILVETTLCGTIYTFHLGLLSVCGSLKKSSWTMKRRHLHPLNYPIRCLFLYCYRQT